MIVGNSSIIHNISQPPHFNQHWKLSYLFPAIRILIFDFQNLLLWFGWSNDWKSTESIYFQIANDCQELFHAGQRASGVYTITLEPYVSYIVWCDFDTSRGWTVMQRRLNGLVSFHRNWFEYETGFCDLNTEHWLGEL